MSPYLQSQLLAWAPVVFIAILWMMYRRRMNHTKTVMDESIILQRECKEMQKEGIELQKKANSLLEDIRAELKNR